MAGVIEGIGELLACDNVIDAVSAYGTLLSAIASAAAAIIALYQAGEARRTRCGASMSSLGAACSLDSTLRVDVVNAGIIPVSNIRLFLRRAGSRKLLPLDSSIYHEKKKTRVDLEVGGRTGFDVGVEKYLGWSKLWSMKYGLPLIVGFPKLYVVDSTGRSCRVKIDRGLKRELRDLARLKLDSNGYVG